MVPIDSASDPGGSSRRVPRRLTFDSEPVTIHDLLAQDAGTARADSGPLGASVQRRAAGNAAPASEPPSRVRRWASFMVPVVVVTAGLASLPAAPPSGVYRAAEAVALVVPASLPVDAPHADAPHAQVAQAAGALNAQSSSGSGASAVAAAAPGDGAVADTTSIKSVLPHRSPPSVVPEGSAPLDDVPAPSSAWPARGALPTAQPAPSAARQAAPGAALRAARPVEGATQAMVRGAVSGSGRAGLQEDMPAQGSGAQPARTGFRRFASNLFEPAVPPGGSQRSMRLAAGGLTRVQAHQCGHLGALSRGFCEQRVQLTYCTGRYGRTGDCPLPTIAMPN